MFKGAALLDIVRIKWLAVKLGIEKILLKNNLLLANFISDPNSGFYRSTLFVSLMNYLNNNPDKMKLKQNESRLTLTITDIGTIGSAISKLEGVMKKVAS